MACPRRRDVSLERTPLERDAAATLAIAAATVTAGCVGPVPGLLASSTPDLDPAQRPTWSEGDWWAYRIETPEGGAAEVAFVVDQAGPSGYRLGSNATSGFFGLPFHGELEPDLDPHVAGERWDMYRFPLEDGRSWTQEFLGHAVTTDVTAADVHGPDGEAVPGYRLEASAYGAPVVTYTYAAEVGWITAFTLREPETGDVIAWANATGAGTTYEGGYLVEEPLLERRHGYPEDLPSEDRFEVAADGVRLEATLAASAHPGSVEAALEAPGGETVLEVTHRGQGVRTTQAEWPVEEGTWTLDHRGLGSGDLALQLHVVREAGDRPPEGVDDASSGEPDLPERVAEALLGGGLG